MGGCMHDNEPSGFIKVGGFLEYLLVLAHGVVSINSKIGMYNRIS
jgi:hypothetical protein